MNRRTVIGGAAGAALAALTGSSAAAEQTTGESDMSGPPTVGPDDLSFPKRPGPLRPGDAAEAGLSAEHVERILPSVSAFMDGDEPSFPGFTVLAARNGIVVEHDAGGHRSRYERWDEESQTAVELPRDQWEPMTTDTIFDLASISKLFTATVAGRLLDEDRIDLDAPVAEYLPEFGAADPAKAPITVAQLLAHTTGMPATIKLWDLPDDQARMDAIYEAELAHPPGEVYEYSDLNLITLAAAAERITGSRLDELVAEFVTGPLGLSDTGYNPSRSEWGRVAPTEYQPETGRGMVRGTVHDENAWSFDGVAGHAGVFSTAWDLAVFGQMILGGGRYDGVRVLSEETTRLVFTDLNAGMGEDSGRGLGWQLDQRWYMESMNSPVTVGHTGFTGTVLVLDPLARTLLVLMTNRVHPTRNWGAESAYRRAASRPFGRSVPVEPRTGRESWFADPVDEATAALAADLEQSVDRGEAEFGLWYDTESTDVGSFEASADGRAWAPVAMDLRAGRHQWRSDGEFAGFSGRRWIDVTAALPAGTRHVRWTYATDPDYRGRGVYVDRIRVKEGSKTVFDSSRPDHESRLVAHGWELSDD